MIATSVRRDESGVTIVELLVAILVSGLFVGLLALTLVNGLRAQEQATARDTATGQANVVVSSLHTAVRNAASFRVSDTGKRLDVVVAVVGSTLTWECQAWRLSGGSLYFSEGTTARPGDIVTGRDPVISGVSATLGSGAVFRQGTGAGTDTIQVQRRLTIGMTITTGDQVATVADAVTAQVVVEGGAPACW